MRKYILGQDNLVLFLVVLAVVSLIPAGYLDIEDGSIMNGWYIKYEKMVYHDLRI